MIKKTIILHCGGKMVTPFAKSYEIINGQCYIDGILQSSTVACDNAFKNILGVLGLIFIPLIIFGIIFFIWWVFCLIHAIKHEDIPDRTVWLIVLIGGFFLGFSGIAAVIYYFAVKRPYQKSKMLSLSTTNTPQGQENSTQSNTQAIPTPNQLSAKDNDSPNRN